MLRLDIFTVNGHCNDLKELEDYIKNLKLLPARIDSYIIGESDLLGLRFSITYSPLKIN